MDWPSLQFNIPDIAVATIVVGPHELDVIGEGNDWGFTIGSVDPLDGGSIEEARELDVLHGAEMVSITENMNDVRINGDKLLTFLVLKKAGDCLAF